MLDIKLQRCVTLSLFVLFFMTACSHRAVGYNQRIGTHPYFTDVKNDKTMTFGIVGNNDSIETGTWKSISDTIIAFQPGVPNGKIRYFKYRVHTIVDFNIEHEFEMVDSLSEFKK